LLVETLLCRIDGQEKPPGTLPTRLIVRRSCGS
jgi:DNA-binding LacI/PurR family transcriptional regulator